MISTRLNAMAVASLAIPQREWIELSCELGQFHSPRVAMWPRQATVRLLQRIY